MPHVRAAADAWRPRRRPALRRRDALDIRCGADADHGAGALAAPFILQVLAPGFASDPERLALSELLVRIMLPFMLFASLAQLMGGMLNGLGRFAAAAAMPILFNAVVISVLLFLSPPTRKQRGDGGGCNEPHDRNRPGPGPAFC